MYTVEEILEHIRGLILQAKEREEECKARMLEELSEWIENGPDA